MRLGGNSTLILLPLTVIIFISRGAVVQNLQICKNQKKMVLFSYDKKMATFSANQHRKKEFI